MDHQILSSVNVCFTVINPCNESMNVASHQDCSSQATCVFDDVSGYRTCDCDVGFRDDTTGGLVPGLDCVGMFFALYFCFETWQDNAANQKQVVRIYASVILSHA